MTSDLTAIATAQDVEWFTVDHQSAVGGARRAANALAHRLGFGEARSAEVALVVSELAGNQLKHAGSGVVVLRTRRSGWDDVAVEVLASDRGPGMRDVTSAMQDGVSSSGTLGIGLGTIPRLASAWDVYSSPGDGTVVAAVFGPHRQKVAWTAGPTGIARAMTGQSMCGDAFALRSDDGVLTALLSDGLGHGPLAAAASQEAVRAFLGAPAGSPASLLGIVHRALAGTRGAAVSIAQPVGDQIRYAGLGNVTAFQRGSGRSRGLMGQPGIAGSGSPKIRESVYPSEGPGMLVLHSDGLTERMNLDKHPGLLSRAPLIVAAVLLRDYGIRRDDASVLVVPLGPQLATSGTGPGLAESRP
jgi:anti-sigma regulatory factor (Ser/Thr protein kinase)